MFPSTEDAIQLSQDNGWDDETSFARFNLGSTVTVIEGHAPLKGCTVGRVVRETKHCVWVFCVAGETPQRKLKKNLEVTEEPLLNTDNNSNDSNDSDDSKNDSDESNDSKLTVSDDGTSTGADTKIQASSKPSGSRKVNLEITDDTPFQRDNFKQSELIVSNDKTPTRAATEREAVSKPSCSQTQDTTTCKRDAKVKASFQSPFIRKKMLIRSSSPVSGRSSVPNLFKTKRQESFFDRMAQTSMHTVHRETRPFFGPSSKDSISKTQVSAIGSPSTFNQPQKVKKTECTSFDFNPFCPSNNETRVHVNPSPFAFGQSSQPIVQKKTHHPRFIFGQTPKTAADEEIPSSTPTSAFTFTFDQPSKPIFQKKIESTSFGFKPLLKDSISASKVYMNPSPFTFGQSSKPIVQKKTDRPSFIFSQTSKSAVEEIPSSTPTSTFAFTFGQPSKSTFRKKAGCAQFTFSQGSNNGNNEAKISSKSFRPSFSFGPTLNTANNVPKPHIISGQSSTTACTCRSNKAKRVRVGSKTRAKKEVQMKKKQKRKSIKNINARAVHLLGSGKKRKRLEIKNARAAQLLKSAKKRKSLQITNPRAFEMLKSTAKRPRFQHASKSKPTSNVDDENLEYSYYGPQPKSATTEHNGEKLKNSDYAPQPKLAAIEHNGEKLKVPAVEENDEHLKCSYYGPQPKLSAAEENDESVQFSYYGPQPKSTDAEENDEHFQFSYYRPLQPSNSILPFNRQIGFSLTPGKKRIDQTKSFSKTGPFSFGLSVQGILDSHASSISSSGGDMNDVRQSAYTNH